MKTNNQIDHLKKNITRLSKMVTSGIYLTDNSNDTEIIFDAHGNKLSDYQMHMHIGALIENLKEFSKTIDDSWTSYK